MVKKQLINPPGLVVPGGYSHVATAQGGKMVYVSGQIAVDEQGEIVGEANLRRQTEKAFANLKVALAGVGATVADVVKLNIYVVDYKPEDLYVIREARSKYFTQAQLPASTLIGVQALAFEGLLIEIEAIAIIE